MINTYDYVSDALNRIEAGKVGSGSHLTGVVNKSAQSFEQDLRNALARLLDASNISYDKYLRAEVKNTAFEKLTLGMICGILKTLANHYSNRLPPPITSKILTDVASSASAVNQIWVDHVKHGGDLNIPEAVCSLKLILVSVDDIKQF